MAISSVLLVCTDRIGERMAGVGVRYTELARVLASRYEVTVAAPAGSEHPGGAWELAAYEPADAVGLAAFAGAADAVVSPVLPATTVRCARPAVERWIFDLYDPEPLESLELLAGLRRAEAVLRQRLLLDRVTTALRAGDAFVCASERQRDLWLGALMAIGRLTPRSYATDESGRNLIDVVPFGLPSDPPVPSPETAMRGRWAGVGRDDDVVLWAGGIWDWLDPLTAIQAIDRLRAARPRVRLVFLGGGRPGGQSAMRMETSARQMAERLGLLGEHVIFNDGWVRYEQRADYLLEADVGISTHLNHVEARFSFRTRILDHVWAGLPTVATEGDAMSETVASAGAGITVGYADVGGLATAIDSVLERGREDYADSFRALRDRFAWPVAAAPLMRLLDAPATAERLRAPVRYAALDRLVARLARVARR